MGIISLTCPNCLEHALIDDSRKVGYCMYCGNKIIVGDFTESKNETHGIEENRSVDIGFRDKGENLKTGECRIYYNSDEICSVQISYGEITHTIDPGKSTVFETMCQEQNLIIKSKYGHLVTSVKLHPDMEYLVRSVPFGFSRKFFFETLEDEPIESEIRVCLDESLKQGVVLTIGSKSYSIQPGKDLKIPCPRDNEKILVRCGDLTTEHTADLNPRSTYIIRLKGSPFGKKKAIIEKLR